MYCIKSFDLLIIDIVRLPSLGSGAVLKFGHQLVCFEYGSNVFAWDDMPFTASSTTSSSSIVSNFWVFFTVFLRCTIWYQNKKFWSHLQIRTFSCCRLWWIIFVMVYHWFMKTFLSIYKKEVTLLVFITRKRNKQGSLENWRIYQ